MLRACRFMAWRSSVKLVFICGVARRGVPHQFSDRWAAKYGVGNLIPAFVQARITDRPLSNSREVRAARSQASIALANRLRQIVWRIDQGNIVARRVADEKIYRMFFTCRTHIDGACWDEHSHRPKCADWEAARARHQQL